MLGVRDVDTATDRTQTVCLEPHWGEQMLEDSLTHVCVPRCWTPKHPLQALEEANPPGQVETGHVLPPVSVQIHPGLRACSCHVRHVH